MVESNYTKPLQVLISKNDCSSNMFILYHYLTRLYMKNFTVCVMLYVGAIYSLRNKIYENHLNYTLQNVYCRLDMA